MSSLTVEMGLRRRRGNSPPIPEQIAHRQDVTLAQKQRLAMLAKMGVGPVAIASALRTPTSSSSAPEPLVIERSAVPDALDRRRALLERERKLRDMEEQRQEEEERLESERRAKQRPRGGLARLGPVMPREEERLQFLPAPAQPAVEATVPLTISKTPAQRTRSSFEREQEEEEDADEEEEELEEKELCPHREPSGIADIDAVRAEAWLRQQVLTGKRAAPDADKPKAKKKKTRKQNKGESLEPEQEEDEADPLEEARFQERRFRDTPRPMMVVESVKGKVSNANRNFTDADLERRFPVLDRERHASLMSEEEALRMIRRERDERGAGSASRRVQRELAEWAAAKESQRARMKSPHRFERMVVSRK